MRSGRGLIAGVVLGIALGRCVGAMFDGAASARAPDGQSPAPRDLEELARMFKDDQSDRMPGNGRPIDWSVILPRDRQRENRAKQLYEAGALRTGRDFFRAAMILQHAATPEDYLLAHEFCVAALAKGSPEARWLAAATEDRFLMKIGRPQRFGTQYQSTGLDRPVQLYEVGPGVTDELRRELGVPSLAEARKREALMQEMIKGGKPAASSHKP